MATTVTAQQTETTPFFDVLAFAAGAPDSTRLDIYVAVPYTAITFERNASGDVGRYRVRIVVDGQGLRRLDTAFARTISMLHGPATIGTVPMFEFFQQRVTVPDGKYNVGLEIVDLRTNAVVKLSRTVVAPDFSSASLALSGLMLVGKIREDSSGYAITPMLSDNVGENEQFFLFFETYNNGAPIDATLAATFRQLGRGDTSVEGKELDITAGSDVGIEQLTKRHIPHGRSQSWVRLRTGELPHGRFTVKLRATPVSDTATTLATSFRSFRRSGSAAASAMDEDELSERIEQLRYVASVSDIETIQSATSLAERQRRFAEFWGRHDLAPTTPENDAMDEYYRRIDYTIDNFRSYTVGWRTDKGRAWVLYGQPDNTNTAPLESGSRRIEQWFYSRRNIRLRFIDESGFGDFRLETPIPPGERFKYP